MKKLIRKPHLFFFGLIPFFLILGLWKRNVPIDLDIVYINYLINVDFWCYTSAVYFGLIGVNYLALNWANRPPKKILTLLHFIFQLLCLIPFLYAIFQLNENGELQIKTFLSFLDLSSTLTYSFLFFLCSIFIHLVNFFSSLLLKRE